MSTLVPWYSCVLFVFAVVVVLPFFGSSHEDSRKQTDAQKAAEIETMYADYRQEFPDVPEVTAAALLRLREAEDVVIVDVREDSERKVSTLPGAISLKDFNRDREQYTGRKVVAYCTIGYRSGLAVRELRAVGVEAFNLKGSILAWCHAGQPLEDADGPTRRVHVYGKKWNLLPKGYEATW